jgi:hypothetical protein
MPYAIAGAVLGAIVRHLVGGIWVLPPAFPAPQHFPAGGVLATCVLIGVAMFVAGMVFTARSHSPARVFIIGVCVGAASLSQYAVLGVSSVAAAGLILLVLAPVAAMAGVTAGIFTALALRADAERAEA